MRPGRPSRRPLSVSARSIAAGEPAIPRACTCTCPSPSNRIKHALSALSGKLEALSPLAVLSRGYGVVSSEEGKVIKEIADVSVGDKITVKVRDGEIYAGVSGTVAADTSVSKK